MKKHKYSQKKSNKMIRYDALEEYMTPEMLRTPLHELALSIRYVFKCPESGLLINHCQHSQASPAWLCRPVPLQMHGASPH